MLTRLKEDIKTVFAKDPAARTTWEVLTCYPGLHAVWAHRLAHWLWQRKFRLAARFASHLNRWFTGIEIHPGASIGRRFFIDHGMGVVIGETTQIGDDVLVYQGAVLGGTSLEKIKRHPTIENSVVIGAGATILGPVVIGNRARIGAGSVVVKSVPDGAVAVGVPAHVTSQPGISQLVAVLEHGRLPDPLLRVIGETCERQSVLEERVRKLEQRFLKQVQIAPAPQGGFSDVKENFLLKDQYLPTVHYMEPEVIGNKLVNNKTNGKSRER